MDAGVALVLVLAAGSACALLLRRPYRGRRATPEEALETETLDAERERAQTAAVEAANRYNLRPPGR